MSSLHNVNKQLSLFKNVNKQLSNVGWTWATSPFQAITISGKGSDVSPYKVWAVSRDGSAFLRHGITDVAPTGQLWIQVHPPSGSSGLKSVSGGDSSLWGLETSGRLWYRQEISPVFPEGTSWTSVPCVPSTPNAFTGGEVLSLIHI